MRKLVLLSLAALLGAVAGVAYAATSIKEATCIVVLKEKHAETRAVFVIRCAGHEDFGLVDIGAPSSTACATDTGSCNINALESVYKKGGAMLMQLDKEEGK
jgi:hypothetical protein